MVENATDFVICGIYKQPDALQAAGESRHNFLGNVKRYMAATLRIEIESHRIGTRHGHALGIRYVCHATNLDSEHFGYASVAGRTA
jgi:hypothetical protein